MHSINTHTHTARRIKHVAGRRQIQLHQQWQWQWMRIVMAATTTTTPAAGGFTAGWSASSQSQSVACLPAVRCPLSTQSTVHSPWVAGGVYLPAAVTLFSVHTHTHTHAHSPTLGVGRAQCACLSAIARARASSKRHRQPQPVAIHREPTSLKDSDHLKANLTFCSPARAEPVAQAANE